MPRALRRRSSSTSTALGVPYVLDPTLVRGLDYYTRTTFEFIGPDENVNSTICGGGRYDGLVEAIGGPPTPGIGFGAGIERLLLAARERGHHRGSRRTLDVFVVVDGGSRETAQTVLQELRRAGLAADMDYAGRSMKGQLTQASRSGAPHGRDPARGRRRRARRGRARM